MKKSGLIYPDPEIITSDSGVSTVKNEAELLADNPNFERPVDYAYLSSMNTVKADSYEETDGFSVEDTDREVVGNSDTNSINVSHSQPDLRINKGEGNQENSSGLQNSSGDRSFSHSFDLLGDFEIDKFGNSNRKNNISERYFDRLMNKSGKSESDRDLDSDYKSDKHSDSREKYELISKIKESNNVNDSRNTGKSVTQVRLSNTKTNIINQEGNTRLRFSLKRRKSDSDKREVKKIKTRVEKQEKSESVFLSFMFIFEIFRWFTGTDVIVRFIIGAILGLIGFGYIFSQLGTSAIF